jgi:WD40 repeat protein
MMKLLARTILVFSIGAAASITVADEPPGFSKQIKPFLAKYCAECHNDDEAEGGLVVETFESLIKGGDLGVEIVPGKPDESRLVLLLEGKAKPKMPPKPAAQPKPEEIALVRAWVAAGAKNDAAGTDATPPKPALPAIKPRSAAPPRIVAAVFSPDGRFLAVAANSDVVLLNPVDGTFFGKLTAHADPVTALAASHDGKRLAVASGAPGQRGEVHLYNVPSPLPMPADLKAYKSIAAHTDVVHAMNFGGDGKLLATCSYDRTVKLWNAESGGEVSTLRDHSDAVYDVTFSPDGKLLASGAADRAVKVWEVVSGRRLYTLSEPTEWIYALAWSPDGKYLAGAGVDKSIRVWDATAAGGKLIHSTFAHDAAVTRLVYAADSKTLYSLSEDRTVKAWDAAAMVERQHFEKLPETPLTLAVSVDGKRLAVGRYDGVVNLFDASTGQKLRDPIAVAAAKPAPKPEPASLAAISPRGGRRGTTVRLVLDGKNLNNATALVFSGSPTAGSIAVKLISDDETAKNANRARADVTIPADAPAGVVRVAVHTPQGNTAELPFAVTAFPEVAEAGQNESQGAAQSVVVPTTIIGSIDRAGDADVYRFDAQPGQQLAFEVVAGAIGSKLEPVLTLWGPSGGMIAEVRGGLLAHTFEQAGSHALRVRDIDYRGSGEMFYRLNVGDMPVITDVFPLGLARGSEIDVEVRGVNLGGTKTVKVKAAENAEVGSRVEATTRRADQPADAGRSPLNSKSLVVGEFPEIIEQGTNDEPAGANAAPTPATINGRIERPGDVDLFRFAATKGQRLILDVNARRLGSPLDSFIEVLDSAGRPVPQATLRCLAQTYTVFRDHDSAGVGIRIESWSELAVNDYVMIGDQLLRIQALPKNPDDDCKFFDVRGQRVGHLGTTPAQVSAGTPIYKVGIHPPLTQFSPNGMPVFALLYQNDDGGPLYDKDSRVFFDPPADGDYLVRIRDVRGHGGPGYAYRLSVRPPRPDFAVSFNPGAPQVWKGGAAPVSVSCDRFDGFEGGIELQLENLPAGFSAPATTIPAGELNTAVALFAEPSAASPPKDAPRLKLVAKAMIDGKEVRHEVAGELPSAVEPGDIVTTVEQSEVTIQPGREAKLTVKIERRNDFKGRIPIEVRGLPHGTRVLDIGLNGILITERETQRTIVLYSEPWAEPTAHPFVVLARREGKNTEHAARSILLKVTANPGATAAAK